MLDGVIQKLKTDRFWRNNLIFFVGSVTVAGFNYLFYPILGRVMEIESFGETQALISMFLQIGILLSAFNLIVANLVTNSSKNIDKLAIIRELEKLAFLILIVALTLTIIFSKQIQVFLNFGSPFPFILMTAAVLVSVPIVFRSAYLQGKLDFLGISIGGIIVAVGKIVFSVILVAIGFHALGVMAGIIIAEFLALLYLIYRVSKKGWKLGLSKSNIHLPRLGSIKYELKYGALVFIVNFIIIILFSSDVVVIKHYFAPLEAGLYAGVAAIGRISFFACLSVAGVMFPSIKLNQSDKKNKQLFVKSLLITIGISAPILLIFSLFPNHIIKLMVGSRYEVEASLLPVMALSAFLISINNLILFYNLAYRRITTVYIAIIAMVFTTFLIVNFHSSLISVINDFIYGNILLLLMLIIWGWSGRFRKQL